MALHWTSALSVGVAELDAQHRELFERVDRLLDAMLHGDRSEAARLLAFLGEFVVVHFAAEERLMEGTAYPGLQRHLDEHRRFGARLHELEAGFREAGPTASLVLGLEHLAVAWLRDHVYSTDVAMGRWLMAQQGGSPGRAPC
jgi:hemerythrin